MKKINNLVSEEAIEKMTGRVIKHASVIKFHAIASNSKLSKKPMQFISIDIESNYETGATHLLGCYNGKKYWYYEQNILSGLAQLINACDVKKKSIAVWSKFDPTQLFRIIAEDLDNDQQNYALKAYQKISVKFNKITKEWDNPPIVERKINNRYIGISSVIRSNIQFFTRKPDDENVGQVWSYNIAPFFKGNLESTAKLYDFDWYKKLENLADFSFRKKGNKSPHLLDENDWQHFHNPKNDEDLRFRNIVIESNKLDAMAAWYFANKVQEEFAEVFYGKYSKTLISSGSLTRAAIAAFIENKHEKVTNLKQRNELIKDDLQSIGIIYHEKSWYKQLGKNTFNDFYSLCHEVYKGAKIECYGYGFFEEAWTADIASAYQKTQVQIKDLRGSIVDYGVGTPPKAKDNEYIIIRGMIDIPPGTEYHPFLIRNPIHPSGNLCPTGSNILTSYWDIERDLGIKMGITFSEEKWYRIKTLNELSPIAGAAQEFLNARYKLIESKSPNEKRAKDAGNGVYGVTYEATPLYDIIDDVIKFVGLRAGEIWNPIEASRTTAETRCFIGEACMNIRENGGKPIFAQTDSITWQGKFSDLDERFWKAKKTLGFFEKPERIKNVISLGAGRYQYYKEDEDGNFTDYVAKTRGVYLDEVLGKDGIVLDNISWREALKNMKDDKINVTVKTLVSPGMINASHQALIYDDDIQDTRIIDISFKDLGRIIKLVKSIDPISGRNKRKIEHIKNYKELAERCYWSEPIPVTGGLILGSDIIDDTLSEMRRDMEKQEFEQIKTTSGKRSAEDKKDYNDKYWLLRNYGESSAEAKKLAHKNWDYVLDKVYNSDTMAEDCKKQLIVKKSY